MQRAIKFRAWDKDRQEMFPVYELVFVPGGGIDIGARGALGMDDWRANCDLMQYTGLKDKNGQEIYERDILKYCTNGRLSAPIEFPKDYTWLKMHTEDAHWRSAVEVIGNIYENPELLPPVDE